MRYSTRLQKDAIVKGIKSLLVKLMRVAENRACPSRSSSHNQAYARIIFKPTMKTQKVIAATAPPLFNPGVTTESRCLRE